MLRGVVIGFGRMGLTHYAILNNHPDVRFVGVCDTSSFMLKSVGQILNVKLFKDYRHMIKQTAPDFAVISTPTALHAESIFCCIEHGVHVFVEKPFVLNPNQGDEILRSLNLSSLMNQVGYVLRFNDVFIQVKKLLKHKVLGDLVIFKMEMNGPTILKDTKCGWRSKENQGGGCLYDFASHSIDMINYLLGVPDSVLGTFLQSIHSEDVEDAVSSTFLYDNGLRGNLLCNWSDASYRRPEYRFEILGRKGKIVADLHAYKIFFKDNPGIEGYSQGWNQIYATDFAEPVRFYVRGYEFTRQLDYFIDNIKNNKPSSICSFEEGYKTDVLIDRIKRDSENGRVH